MSPTPGFPWSSLSSERGGGMNSLPLSSRGLIPNSSFLSSIAWAFLGPKEPSSLPISFLSLSVRGSPLLVIITSGPSSSVPGRTSFFTNKDFIKVNLKGDNN
ncbi:MAG: hypothetical protein UU11_C0011G0002 [Parcubacteria group bacterium GW2011_GWF2_40_69]|nr:MAG: hypothetical protein UU11_C0011G0002 [Parcubacteria group bacterium GW2011_GWF2_40_69]